MAIQGAVHKLGRLGGGGQKSPILLIKKTTNWEGGRGQGKK